MIHIIYYAGILRPDTHKHLSLTYLAAALVPAVKTTSLSD